MEHQDREWRIGLINGLAAHLMWGFMPVYLRQLKKLGPDVILAYRVSWTCLVLVVLLTAWKAWPTFVQAVCDRRTFALLCLSSVLLVTNWLVFIYAVNTDRIRFGSLGYFLNPLVNVFLGMVFFGERLRPGQWFALTIATAGLAWLVWSLGTLPWITLTLACSFAVYALIRKVTPVESLVALSIESFLMVTAAILYIVFGLDPRRSPNTLGQHALLSLSGIITIGPLLCFGAAARRLPMTVLGFLQYLAPSLQLLVGLYIFGESLTHAEQVCFACTWIALAVLTAEALYVQRQEKLADLEPAPCREELPT